MSSAAAAPGRAVHPAQRRQVPHHRAVAVVAPLHQSQTAPQRAQDRGGVAAERGERSLNIVYIIRECLHQCWLQMEVEQLKARCEKLEKERNAFKFNSDQLEAKVRLDGELFIDIWLSTSLIFIMFQVSEMSVDLADEQTTANQASEILETEQAERRRLEKEVKELTVRLKNDSL